MLNAEQEFSPDSDKLTLESDSPLMPDADGKYPIPEPGMTRGQVREAVYAQARRLLRAGEDRNSVRDATGLKLAEIDLLRCARAGGRAA